MPSEYKIRIQDIKSYPYRLKDSRKRIDNPQMKCPLPLFRKEGCGILSCKNDDRHPYNKWNKDTVTKLNRRHPKLVSVQK